MKLAHSLTRLSPQLPMQRFYSLTERPEFKFEKELILPTADNKVVGKISGVFSYKHAPKLGHIVGGIHMETGTYQ